MWGDPTYRPGDAGGHKQEEQGGLFESESCAPEMAVLGEWMRADAQGVGREYEYPRPPEGKYVVHNFLPASICFE